MAAAANGQQEAVEYLLSKGGYKRLTDLSGRTAYDYAVASGWTNLANLLK